MSKRRTPGQRVVEFFMTAPIAEVRAAVDVARVIVEAREAGHDQIAWPAPKPKPTPRKPRAKKAPTSTSSTISSAVAGEKVQ